MGPGLLEEDTKNRFLSSFYPSRERDSICLKYQARGQSERARWLSMGGRHTGNKISAPVMKTFVKMIISRSLFALVSSFGKSEIIVQTPQNEREDLRDNSHQVVVSSKCLETNKKPFYSCYNFL